MIFKINGVDFTNNVVNGTYDVNMEERFSEWEDANHRVHRSDYHTKIKGRVDVYFKLAEDYDAFCGFVNDGKLSDGRCSVKMSVNNTGATFDGFAWVKFEPLRATNETIGDFYNQFTVSVEEA